PVALLDLNASETFKFLPSAITDFRPSINEPIVPCSSELLQSKCDHWLKEIKSYFVPELVNLLNFVNSVKSMAFIREAVFNHLCEEKSWNKLCSSLLKTPFSIWDYFLKDCFLQRIKDIINGCIKSSSEMCQQDIERTLDSISNVKEDSGLEFEKNISLYVWMESSNDVVNDIAWIPRHQRNIINSGELSMKAMGFTPKIQRICKDLDQRMQDAVEDISHFSLLQKGSIEGINLSSSQMNLLDISEDATNIFKYLEEAVESHIFDLASYIETTLLYMENEKHSFENSCRIVFMGHLCLGIANLCPHINTCLSPETVHEKIRTNKRQALKENELWKEIKNKLQKVSASAFKLWGSWQIDQILKNLDSELIAGSAEGLLKALLMWEKVEIQEESEQGKSVKSVLRIPQHVSMPLSNALFGFCCQLNFIGGFAISSEVRSEISKQLLIGLLDIYQRKVDASAAEDLNPRLLQVQSLQYLFDVQFLIGFMVHKDNTSDAINSTSQDIMNRAISYIDPFDMDVFSAPLQQNLKKALQKSLSLFGLIASPDQVSYLNSIKAHSVSSQMEHNIIPSSNNIRRFPILPLSSRTNIMVQGPQDDFQVQTKETDKKPLQSHSSSPNLSASDIPTNPMKSTSFYDRVTAMSSSWFGN
ncbi:conserved oligomeric Golgi complex subunit 1-like, partial [Stegodyphus dumicola]|uniref:conserved oligomeric Golgi complex subunit 1-like n=1 Tax=Stegodyphus dumicola TaxID=202533 RepID=UPI0015AC9B03